MPHTIFCPTGLTGTLRGLKVREERILADRKLAKSNGVIDELLRACWLEIHDTGPYDFTGGKVDWDQVLQGDRFAALVEIRTITYGPEYAFSVSCREEACRARIDWEVDLRDLPRRRLSDASREAFLSGNRFKTTLPEAGRTLWFKLLTGADERKLPGLRKNAQDRILSAMLAFRCVEVEGIEAKDKRRFLEDLSMRDADFLMGEFDRVDCGIETAIEIECPECRATQGVDLPFDQTFFMPRKGRKTAASSTTESSADSSPA